MSGERLRGRYELLAVVGRGGEGEVVRAVDHLHGREVALKIRRVADDASRAHLLSEARLLLSLTPHPGLPLVREDFFDDGRYVIAMDWIDGTDLDAVLAAEGRPGLDPETAIEHLEQAAAALEHLHEHDPPVVHGDVKPANLIRTSSGRVVVVDFGLSSTPSDDRRRAGTAGFVAPEVAAGARPTRASDVYSLAATAVALLTGERLAAGAPTWVGIEPQRVAALERIVRRNLATDPDRRDASAGAFVSALRRWWGAALPGGTVTLVLADLGDVPGAEEAASEVAGAHGGHGVAPAGDGPLLAAFAAADDGFGAAREVASRFRARVAAVTCEAEPRAGAYDGAAVTAARALLERAGRAEVYVDDATANAVDGRLPTEQGLARLADKASWLLVAPGLSSPSRVETCPYRGLMAFEPEDGDLYFGREEVVSSTLERLLAGGSMAIVGASGSGKSSLVRAGLVPAFRRARDGPAVVFTPGADPTAALTGAVAAAPPSLVVVDQMEEAFTLCPDEAARTRFFDAVLDLAGSGTTAVVLVLRADFYGRCADHPRLAAAVADRQLLLGPMRRDELRRAIEDPARAVGLRLEAGLAETMLAELDGEPGALPLLSHALYETWARRDGRVLTREGYVAAGGVRGAIAKTAEDVYLACTESEQAVARRTFLRLTELGESTEDTRRRAPLAELVPEGAGGDASAVLERLASSRLLVLGDDSAEIAHEALIREWPRLRGWLAEDRDELRTLRQLTNAAHSWDEGGRDDADLLRGARLDAAAALADEGRGLSRVEYGYVQASRDAQDSELRSVRRRARRLRALLVAVAALLVAALVAGAFALVQRGNARDTATVAQAGRLAAQSREAAADHPDLGLLLALEAGRLDDSVDTRGALLGALEHGAWIRAWLQGFDSAVVSSAFRPDGRLLATTTIEGTTLWDTRTWRRVGQPLRSAQGGWNWVEFSPDGRTLAIAGAQGRVELWDVSTRTMRRELVDPAASTAADPGLAVVRYSPDGRVIAAGGQESNHVTLWDAASGHVIGRPIVTHRPGEGQHSVDFSPDSKRIVTTGNPGTVAIWEVGTGRRVGAPLAIGDGSVEAAIYGPGGRTLIASDDAGLVHVVDAATGQAIRPPLSVADAAVAALDVSPDGRLLAAGAFDGSIVVVDTATGAPYGAPLRADTGPVGDVSFAPDGRTLASSNAASAVVWNMDGQQAIGQPLGGPSAVTTDVAFSSDGSRLAAGRLDGSTVVYDTASRREAITVEGDEVVTAVAFDPAGLRIAIGTIDGRVRFVDPSSGAPTGAPIDVGRVPIWHMAFSPDGRRVALAVDRNGVDGYFVQKRHGEVQLREVESGRLVGRPIEPRRGSVLAVAFSPDGTLLATASYAGRLDLWSVATGRRHGRSMAVTDDGFSSVAFDASGQLVAAGSFGPVRVWRVADQRPAFPPRAGHTGPVTGASFDRAGTFLATTALFGATRLWDPATGLGYGDDLASSPVPASLQPQIDLPILPLRNAFSPDGKQLAVGGLVTVAMLWDLDPAVWRERACTVAGRNLTREEWRLYLPSGTDYRATCAQWPAP